MTFSIGWCEYTFFILFFALYWLCLFVLFEKVNNQITQTNSLSNMNSMLASWKFAVCMGRKLSFKCKNVTNINFLLMSIHSYR